MTAAGLLGRAPRLPFRQVVRIGSDCRLGESPIDAGPAGVRWVDAEAGAVHGWRDGRHQQSVVLPGRLLSALVPTVSGGLIALVGTQVLAMPDPFEPPPGDRRAEPRVVASLARSLASAPEERFNDAAVGPDGRLWVGTVVPGRPNAGGLWCLEPGGRLRRQWSGVDHGNGIAWSPDGSVMYVVDTGRGTIWRADRSPTGELSGRQMFFRLARRDGLPDGLTTDSTGALWLAVWGAGCLLRLSPTGRLLGGVPFLEPCVTSCAFVGPLADLLLVTTARDPDDPAAPGGATYLLDVGVTGLPTARFDPADRSR